MLRDIRKGKSKKGYRGMHFFEILFYLCDNQYSMKKAIQTVLNLCLVTLID